MKLIATAALIVLTSPAVTLAAEAADPHAHHMPADTKKAAMAVHQASGTVKKIDAAGGSVTLAHGPVPALKWPSMTMKFKVADKALFDKLAVDRKIEFEFVEKGKVYIVTAVK